MHGGTNPGAPIGNCNAWKHGERSEATRAMQDEIEAFIRDARQRLTENSNQ
jgi:uncharacterized protein YjcR